jgi:hypothetical protein
MLQVQIRIEAAHRDYNAREREGLSELFGAEADWSRTLRGLLWTTASLPVSVIAASCTVDLPLPCSYDYGIAVTKYFEGVEDGYAPLLLLFGGSVFFRDRDGDLQIAQIAHHKEAGYRLPVGLWRQMIDHFYPDTVWLPFSRETFGELNIYKRRLGLATPQEALRRLVAGQSEEVRQ